MENNEHIDDQFETPDYNPNGLGVNFDRFDKNKKAFLKALENCLGVVSDAARQTKLSRASHYLWVQEDEAYRKAVEEIMEARLDFAESRMLKGIKDGNERLITFFLRTKGKARGYMEQQTMIDIDKIERATIQLPGGSIDI